MRSINRSALVPFTAAQMYALVADIASYPSFLRSCSGAEVHAEDAKSIDATLEFSLGGIKKSFRTRNVLWPGEKMDIALIDGPFRVLAGGWRFDTLGEDGCKISLVLEFEFENAVLDALFGHYFEEICNRLVNAFTRRARQLYA
jgi:ribosome-associated toxin RatA of RatAB toxin-antitoxin module